MLVKLNKCFGKKIKIKFKYGRNVETSIAQCTLDIFHVIDDFVKSDYS